MVDGCVLNAQSSASERLRKGETADHAADRVLWVCVNTAAFRQKILHIVCQLFVCVCVSVWADGTQQMHTVFDIALISSMGKAWHRGHYHLLPKLLEQSGSDVVCHVSAWLRSMMGRASSPEGRGGDRVFHFPWVDTWEIGLSFDTMLLNSCMETATSTHQAWQSGGLLPTRWHFVGDHNFLHLHKYWIPLPHHVMW